MNTEFIKQRFNEGQNTEYTHMLILEDKHSKNTFSIYLNRDNVTFEVVHNFLSENIYDYVLLFSLEHDIDAQIERVTEELHNYEEQKKKEKLEQPVLKLFI